MIFNHESECYPNFAEARKASETVDMLMKQLALIPSNREVAHVINEISIRFDIDHVNLLVIDIILSYGYILGKRAERARRKKTV